MLDKNDISDWVIQAKKGHQKAFNHLLNFYWKKVYRFQLGKCSNEDEAEDNTIKTFARAFDNIEKYDSSFKFETWLFTISNHIYIDDYRKKKAETVSINKDNIEIHKIMDEDPSPVDQLINEQNLAQLKAYIRQLKPHYQKVINLRYFQELSYKEIAQKLDEPLNNVKIKLLRARKLLAEIINHSNNEV